MASRAACALRAAAPAATPGGGRLPHGAPPAAVAAAHLRRLVGCSGGRPAAASEAATPRGLSTWRQPPSPGGLPPHGPVGRLSGVATRPPATIITPLLQLAPPLAAPSGRRHLSAAAAPPPPPPPGARQGKPFLLADIGEGITTVTVTAWKVAVGDTVAAFDPVAEVASDKASVEITAPWGGVVGGLGVAEGAIAAVGQPLCWIDPGGGGAGGKGDGEAAGPAAPAAKPAAPPARGEGDVAAGGAGVDGASGPALAGGANGAPPPSPGGRPRPLAAPAVRARAREAGVDLALVDGTGPGGRVVAADVARVAAAAAASASPRVTGSDGGGGGAPLAAAAAGSGGDGVLRVPLTLVREAMVRTMTAAAAIPHLRLITPVDVTELVELRRRLNASLAATPPATAAAGSTPPVPAKLTYLPFFLRATSMALTAHPHLNATFPPPHDAVLLHGGHHISVAVDTPAGLYVPTVRDAGGRSVIGLGAEVARLAAAAAAGRLGVADAAGGTVGLSNIGALGGRPPVPVGGKAGQGAPPPLLPPAAAGGMVGLPLLLPPQVLIGAVGDVVWAPQLGADGGVTRRAVVQVCWAADHRVVEGGAVARYAATWRALVECPERLLLGE